MQRMRRSYITAFTMTEILVVVTIIGIVTTVPLFAYSQISKNARDGRRKEDLAKVATALQQYRSERGTYPNVGTYTALGAELIPEYMAELPEDPRDDNPYEYSVGSSGRTYMLIAKLDKMNGNSREVFVQTQAGPQTVTGTPPAPTGFMSPTGPNPLSYTPLPSRTPTASRTPTPGGSTTWARRFSGTVVDRAVQVSGSEMATLGRTTANPGEGIISFINSGGVVSQSRRYSDPSISTGGVTFSDGYFDGSSLVVAGSSMTGTMNRGLVMKLNSSRQVDWAKRITYAQSNTMQAVAKFGTDIVVAGNYKLANNSGYLVLAKYDSIGDLQTIKRLSIAGVNDYTVGDIASDSSGNFIITGSYGTGIAFVLNVNNSLTEVNWSSRLSNTTSLHGMNRVLPLTGGANGYLLAGYVDSDSDGDNDGWIVRLDNAGSALQGYTYGSATDNLLFSDITVANDGGYLVSGTRTQSPATPQGSIFKLNTSFTPVWYREAGDAATPEGFASIMKMQSGYILGGSGTYAIRMTTAGAITNCTSEFTTPATPATGTLLTQAALTWAIADADLMIEESLDMTVTNNTVTPANVCN